MAAVAGNTVPPANMYVPPLITSRGAQCGEGAKVKTKPTMKKQSMDSDDSAMEVGQPPVPKPKPHKPEVPSQPVLVDDDGMNEWTHKMVSEHHSDEAADFEKWSKSIIQQLKVSVSTITQPLRIKKDSYSIMFHNKCQLLELVIKNQETVRKANKTLK